MKLITLNTHSLLEEHYEEKLRAFADLICKERPDILAMQEVNQLASEEILPDETIPGDSYSLYIAAAIDRISGE